MDAKLTVGSDFSDASDLAVKVALHLAPKLGLIPQIVHIESFPSHPLFNSLSKELKNLEDRLENESLENIVKQLSRIGSSNAQYEAKIYFGDPLEEILRHLLNSQNELLVVASRRHSRLERLLLGSVSAQLLRQSSTPVLVAKNEALLQAKKIFLASDLKASSRKAYEQAVKMAKALDAQLTIVHIVEPGSATGPTSQHRKNSHLTLEELLAQGEAFAYSALEETKNHLERQGIKCQLLIESDIHLNPGTHLVKLIEQHSPELVVMGSRQVNNIEKWLLGSTAEILSNRSPSSVLIAK